MTRYTWEPEIDSVYDAMVKKVKKLQNGKWSDDKYNIELQKKLKEKLDKEKQTLGNSPSSTIHQFHRFMPAHAFKIQATIDFLSFSAEVLLPLKINGSHLVVIDIGCGGATTSTAILNAILQKYTSNVHLLLIGIDPNKYAIQLYNWMMSEYSKKPKLKDRFKYHAVAKGMPEGLTYIAEGLSLAKQEWGIPSISDIWIIQSNVVRPLHDIWKEDIDTRNQLTLDAYSSLMPDNFGEMEARAYEQLLQISAADRMFLMTTATEEWRNGLIKFGDSLFDIFKKQGHESTRLHQASSKGQPFQVEYDNPHGSHWREEKNIRSYKSLYYVDTQVIQSKNFRSDTLWQRIIEYSNLKRAWARVRAGMLRETIVDEVGISLFERKLDENLETIRNQLLTYTTDLTKFSRLLYYIPKGEGKNRPRAIQSIQEEILAVAVIQVLGITVQELMSRNYGYRLDMSGNTEYLYRPWFRAYGRFRDTVRRALNGIDDKGDDKGIVLRSDISSFYASIPLKKLSEAVIKTLNADENPRMRWILEQFFLEREPNSHSGVLQGPLASGFWANLYLFELDRAFSDTFADMHYNTLFFRYVDDIVVIAPNRTDTTPDNIYSKLESEVKKLGLSLSDDKTNTDCDRDNEIKEMQKNKKLDDLEKLVQALTDGLYFTDQTYRKHFKDSADWWNQIRIYQQCLKSLGIFVETSRLSRKIWQYIKKPALRAEKRRRIPSLENTNNSKLWALEFRNQNPQWVKLYDYIKDKLDKNLSDTWNAWIQNNNSLQANPKDKLLSLALKKAQTGISFAINRLARLGYTQKSIDIIREIFEKYPYVIKSPRVIFEHLALQGHIGTLYAITDSLYGANFPGVESLRALIIRFFRGTKALENPEVIGFLENVGIGANNATSVESLMATETLLFTSSYRPNPARRSDFYRRADELKVACPQVARNLLFLALRGQQNKEYFDLLNTLLIETYSLGDDHSKYIEPEFDSDRPEPDILRKYYYYSRYPDNVEEFDGDYF